jgi:hypothetical protein
VSSRPSWRSFAFSKTSEKKHNRATDSL